MVTHEFVLDKKGNHFLATDTIKRIKAQQLYTTFGAEVSYVSQFKNHKGTPVGPFFKCKFNGLIENGKRYYSGEGMSKEHYETQKLLENFLEQFISNPKYKLREQPLDLRNKHLADIYYEFEGGKYVIEVQRSAYTDKIYDSRTLDYKEAGINICWLILPDDEHKLNSRNFPKATLVNGDYTLCLPINDLTLNNLTKIKSNGDILYFEENEFDLETFTNFFFKNDWGLPTLDIKKIELRTSEREIIRNQNKIQDINHDLCEVLEIFNNLKEQEEKLSLQNTQLVEEIDNNQKIFYDSNKLIRKPLLEFDKLIEKNNLLKLENKELFEQIVARRREVEDYTHIMSKLKLEKNVNFLKKHNIIMNPMEGVYMLIEED